MQCGHLHLGLLVAQRRCCKKKAADPGRARRKVRFWFDGQSLAGASGYDKIVRAVLEKPP